MERQLTSILISVQYLYTRTFSGPRLSTGTGSSMPKGLSLSTPLASIVS